MRKKFMALDLLPKGERAKGISPRAKPGLADVYSAAKLPHVRIPDQLPKGEQQMLADRKLQQYVKDLYVPPTAVRVDKSSKAKPGRPAGRPQ